MPYEYDYPRPALTVDCVVFGRDRETVKLLLVQRAKPPFVGAWALPGGYVELHETLEQAALRELREETGLDLPRAEQLGAFDAVDRDPRERVISIAHVAIVEDVRDHAPKGGDDAGDARWFDLALLPELAFDHAQIVRAAERRALRAAR